MKKLALILPVMAIAAASAAFTQGTADQEVAAWQRQAQNVSIVRDDWGIAHVGFTSSRWGSLASFGARTYPGTKKMYGTSGNSFVAVVEFGDTVRARAVSAGGESGDPRSRHFKDQAERYATGNLRDVYFSRKQLDGHIEREYHPGQAAQASLVVRPELERPDRIADWTLDGSGSWEISSGALVLVKAGTPAGPIRRPAALAILKSEPLGKVTVEAEVKSTAPVDLLVRDVELVVGYESPSRFYYIHLAGKTDAVHNGIFLVADSDRRRVDAGAGEPQMRDQAWHRARLERDPGTGRIDVYVDGSAKPVLQAADTTIRDGQIGFGSFDETGEFRNIAVTSSVK